MLGTAKERQQAHPPSRADELAAITLRDHEDRPVQLGDLWSRGPAALVWLRHYG